jgi:hypothetical protein
MNARRVRKSFGRAATGIAVCGLLLSAPAGAAVVSGSNLNGVPEGYGCYDYLELGTPVSCTYAILSLPPASRAASDRAATSGVIVSWSVKVGASSETHSIRLRVIRDTTGAGAGPVEQLPKQAGVYSFPARLPVAAGDLIGLDSLENGLNGGLQIFRNIAGANARVWEPKTLGDGEQRDPTTTYESELMVNATIEPDADGDGYGDESQDPCPSAATGAAACPTPAVAPQTSIRKGPKGKIAASRASFRFGSTVAGSTFQCKLDKKPFKACKSPKTYKNLARGKHTFRVRAIGPTGLIDASPAKRTFRVKL